MKKIRLLLIAAVIVLAAAALSHLNPEAEKALRPLNQALTAVRTWSYELFVPPTDTTETPSQQGTRVYKWQDHAGEWQFSSVPPPPGISSSVTIYHSDTNVVQSVQTPSQEPAATSSNSEPAPTTPSPLLPITDPDRVQQLMEDAHGIQDTLDKRQQALEQNSGG